MPSSNRFFKWSGLSLGHPFLTDIELLVEETGSDPLTLEPKSASTESLHTQP